MATVARIEASLGLNDAEFLAGIARAEKRAQTFSERSGHFVEKTFRKHGSAQVAIAQLGSNLIGGNLEGALQGLTMHMAGLGLAAGAGVAVAAEAFISLKQHFEETEAAAAALRKDMEQPLELMADAGQADAAIASIAQHLDTLQEKQSNWQSQYVEGWKEVFIGVGAAARAAEERQRESQGAFSEAQQLARRSGQMARDTAQAQSDPSYAGKMTGSMLKFDQEEAKAKLDARQNPALAKGLKDQMEAIRIRREYAADALAEQDEANQRETETTRNVLALRLSGVSEETAKRIAAEYRIRDIQASLTGHTLSDSQRRQLQTEQGGLGAGVQEAAFKRAQGDLQKTPEQREAELAGRLRDQHEAEFFGKRGMLTPGDVDLATKMGQNEAHVRMGTWDYSQGKDETGAKDPLTREDLDAIMQKYWGGN